MYSIYYITGQIRSIDVKISQCHTAKAALQSVKNTCQVQITSLKSSKNKITGDLETVKKEDVFEGEMANTLAPKVSTFKTDVDTVITQAEAIVTAINTEISTIDNRITALNGERANWNIHLTNVQNQP